MPGPTRSTSRSGERRLPGQKPRRHGERQGGQKPLGKRSKSAAAGSPSVRNGKDQAASAKELSPNDEPLGGHGQPEERLQKVMAAAGIGSRRKCEELIQAGRVEVDGRVITKLGTKVQLGQQEISVDGVSLKAPRKLYYLVNKPQGVVTTNFDPSGRPRVIDLVPPTNERLFAVGRLDRSSEGLILVTNDGELAQRLTHPRYGIPKTYRAHVEGVPEREVLERLKRGIHLAEGIARADHVEIKAAQKNSAWLEIVLSEGKNREIRRLLAKIGHKVLSLVRIAIGELKLKDLEPGQTRPLSTAEVRALWRYVKSSRSERKKKAGLNPHPRKPRPVKEPSDTPDFAAQEGRSDVDEMEFDDLPRDRPDEPENQVRRSARESAIIADDVLITGPVNYSAAVIGGDDDDITPVRSPEPEERQADRSRTRSKPQGRKVPSHRGASVKRPAGRTAGRTAKPDRAAGKPHVEVQGRGRALGRNKSNVKGKKKLRRGKGGGRK